MPYALHPCRSAIEEVIQQTGKDPATGQPLTLRCLYPNLALRDLIQEWTITNAEQLDPQVVQRVTQEAAAPDATPRAGGAAMWRERGEGSDAAHIASAPESRAGRECEGRECGQTSVGASPAAELTNQAGAHCGRSGGDEGSGPARAASAGQPHDRQSVDQLSRVNALFVPAPRCAAGDGGTDAGTAQCHRR